MNEFRIDTSVLEQFLTLHIVKDKNTLKLSVSDETQPILTNQTIFPMNIPMTNLDDVPWSVIDEIGKNGLARTYFALGATKKDFMKNGFVAEYQIIGFDHDDLANGHSKAPITWDMVRVYKDELCMKQNGDKSCWDTSDARAYLNGEFFSNISDELQQIIKPVIKLTVDVSGTGKLIESVDHIWLKSEQEQFGRKIWSLGGEGHWYELFMLEDVMYFKTDDEGEKTRHWLRSVSSSYTSSFCFVHTGGSANSSYSRNSIGVAPGFCT